MPRASAAPEAVRVSAEPSYGPPSKAPTIVPAFPSLSGLPADIVVHIADCLRYPISPPHQAAELFLFEGRTRFSSTRFPLSSFSQVCRSVRPAVERILYRDIHLDNVGWIPPAWPTSNSQKHMQWPAASLPLLLRTLDQRPELGGFVRSVQLHWCENLPAGHQMHLGLVRFLNYCPRLHRLAISNISRFLLGCVFDPLRLKITSFAAATAARNFERVIGIFPHLRDLHLQLYDESSLLPPPPHNLCRMRLEYNASEAFLRHVFAICGDTVEDLDIEGILGHSSCNRTHFPSLVRTDCKNTRHLCLRSIDAINFPPDGPHPLDSMPSLRHLRIIRPPYSFSPSCLTNLPLHLHSITFSDYARNLEIKSQFVFSLVGALDEIISRIARILTYGAIPDDPCELGDLDPIRSLCTKGDIPFLQTGAYAGTVDPEIIIVFN